MEKMLIKGRSPLCSKGKNDILCQVILEEKPYSDLI
jgi:hypothetical protein